MKHALGVLVLLLAPSAARAADLPCGPAEKGTIQLDGLTDDWTDVQGVDAGGGDSNLSFSLKCNVEEQQLVFVVDVRDNYFVRTKQMRPGEDHFELRLGRHTLAVYPGDARSIPTVARFGSKPAKGVQAVSALQEHGWAVELAVPMAALPGFKPGMPLTYAITVADCDSKAQLKTERTLAQSGSIVFAEGKSALDSFLKDRGFRKSDIWFDRGLSMGKKQGGRVVIAGHDLAFISDGYVYLELPFLQRSDVKDVRLVDLAGDGRQAVAVRYVEHGGGGAREVLAIYRPAGDSEIRRVFAAEVGKITPAGRVEDKVSFPRRGRATDVEIDAGAAQGVNAATWSEAPADDMIPVLLPWGGDKHARYQFTGDEYKRSK